MAGMRFGCGQFNGARRLYRRFMVSNFQQLKRPHVWRRTRPPLAPYQNEVVVTPELPAVTYPKPLLTSAFALAAPLMIAPDQVTPSALV